MRDGDLQLRAQPGGNPAPPLDEALEFIESVKARHREGRVARSHRRDMLTYFGLPWRGELWLGDDVRLGPPSRFPDALLGPQVVVVDAMCEGLGEQGVTKNFQRRVHELRAFLGFAIGMEAKPVRVTTNWVYEVAADGRVTDCVLRPIGYVELDPIAGFPTAGNSPPAARREVLRPGIGPTGISPEMVEEWVPGDIEALWGDFVRLSDSKRDQLMRAANAYLIARQMWPDQRTAYATFLVVACEALKPTGRRHKGQNIFAVVAELLGDDESTRLRKMAPNPQKLRSRHVHRGELAAGELLPMLMDDYFADPSFDEMIRDLSRITRSCLIEWLRRHSAGSRGSVSPT